MTITMNQQILLMGQPVFWKRIQLAGLSVASDVFTETIDGVALTIEEHEKRFQLAHRAMTQSESIAKQVAPATARFLGTQVEISWPLNMGDTPEAAIILAESIPDQTYVDAVGLFWSAGAGWDAVGEAWRSANP